MQAGKATLYAGESSVGRQQLTAAYSDAWPESARNALHATNKLNFVCGAARERAKRCAELSYESQTTELVMGQLVDGIHPTASANDRIAAALLKMMEERKMRR